MESVRLPRRAVLRMTAGLATASTVSLAGCGGSSNDRASNGGSSGNGGSGSDYGGWFGGSKGGKASNYDGTTADKTGQDSVTIKVGADGNGGTYAFSPAAVKISPGTKVTFQWVSNTHNIKIQDQPSGANWQGESSIKNKGYTYSYTFQTAGTYKYYCQPHLSLGMKGVIVVA